MRKSPVGVSVYQQILDSVKGRPAIEGIISARAFLQASSPSVGIQRLGLSSLVTGRETVIVFSGLEAEIGSGFVIGTGFE